MKKRVTWIDVAKFFGILCIYIGHFGQEAGQAYPFVFFFHVPLFFFLSGCTESMNKESSILVNILKKVFGILIPYLFFVFLSLLIHIWIYRPGWETIREFLFLILKGCVRNTYIDGSLWFLTCLFVISVMFVLLRQIAQKLDMFLSARSGDSRTGKYASFAFLLGISLFLYFASERLFPSRPAVDPRWVYNTDSACYYLVYYCLGYLLFGFINSCFHSKELLPQIVMGITTGGSLVYAIFLYFENNLLGWMYSLPILDVFGQILMILVVIWLVLVLSFLCRKCRLFQKLGQNTLYMCGNEGSIKLIFATLAQKGGFYLGIQLPVLIYVYSFFLLLVVNTILVPVEKPVITFFRKTMPLKNR